MIRQCLNRRIDSIDTLRTVAAWQAARDRIQAKVNWQFNLRRRTGQTQTPLSDF